MNSWELIIGFIFGILFLPWLGLITFPMAILTSYWWALSGSHGQRKFWRRYLTPALPCILITVFRDYPYIWIGYPLAVVALSLGYGIPDLFQGGDTGSVLGRFWFRVFRRNKSYNMPMAEFFTRLTIYFILALSYLPLLWLSLKSS